MYSLKEWWHVCLSITCFCLFILIPKPNLIGFYKKYFTFYELETWDFSCWVSKVVSAIRRLCLRAVRRGPLSPTHSYSFSYINLLLLTIFLIIWRTENLPEDSLCILLYVIKCTLENASVPTHCVYLFIL